MAAPANNPFGAPPSQVHNNNPFGAPASAFNNQPFQAPKANPFGAPVNNNPFGAPAPRGTRSAFGSPAVSPAPSRQPSPAGSQVNLQVNNPFGAPPPGGPKSSRSPSPFGSRAPPTGPSGQSAAPKAVDASAMGRRNKVAGGKPSAAVSNNVGFGGRGGLTNNAGFGGRGGQTNGGFGGRGGHTQGPQRATPFASTKPFANQPIGQVAGTTTQPQPGGRGKQPGRQERYQPPPSQHKGQQVTARGPSERTKQLSNFAFNYANKLYDHLKKENISPPKWHPEPGDPSKRAAIETLKDAYKKYRTRVYATLRKADLIDDPEKRRKLEDALPFKGICENMCPEFEQVSRIAEYDVKTEEKEMRPDGLTMWPDTTRMVKKFGRSAAGQDAPLPMDVRSVDALRRTTDYLFNDLLQSESNLPSMHNFLWDRTRAVRKDFTFHSQKSAEEMKDMVYCFETITRFHATALHLLSKKGFANEDFDQRQEIEQLGRTILSLIEAYDMCRDKHVHCENEPEFRAYYLLLNAHDPSIARRIPTWGKEYWFESEELQTALSLIQAMKDVREPKGPIKPRVETTLADTSFTNYFSIVEDPRVSYTMACVAEVHFTTVRQAILRNLVRGYARHRDAPRTISASDLNAMLRFDTPEEAVEFAELHDFEFSTWVPEGRNPVTEPYLLLNSKKKVVPSPRVRQSFSGKVVERKRTTQSLPHVIYNTIFEEPTEKPPSSGGSPDSLFSEDGGLFVSRAPASEDLSMASPTLVPPVQASIPPAAIPSPFGAPSSSSPFAMGGSSGAAPTPAFQRFPASQPSTSAAPGPFAALSQPTPQAQVAQSPFSSLNQSPASSTTGTTLKPASVLGQTPSAPSGQTTTSPFAAAKPAEGSNPFAFLKSPGSTTLPSLAQATQPQLSAGLSSPSFPPAPSLLGSTAPKPATTPTPAQDAVSAQPKPTPPASILGSAPLTGASLFPTTTFAKPTAQQATAPASAIPSIQVSPPFVTAAPAPPAQGLQPSLSAAPFQPLGKSPLSSFTSQTPGLSSLGGSAVAPPRPPPPPKRDLLGDFTKWFVKGDDGLMVQFTEEILRHKLWAVWKDFEQEEVERTRREEDEESWRVAREHQSYRLRLKFFYRWRNNARSLATKRILREGKEKMRLYREQQKAVKKMQQEEKEKAEREARRAAKRQFMEDSHRLSLLASSTGRRNSVAYSADHNPEEQLLASGIFAGMRDDPRSVARRVVREAAATNGADSWAMASATRSFRYPESELELEPAPSPHDHSPDASSVGGGRREGWKTRSLREKFGIEPRRSLSASGGGSGSAVGNAHVNGGSFASSSSRFAQSYSGIMRSTNFFGARLGGDSPSFRKRSAEEESDDEPGAKRQSVFYGGGSTNNNRGSEGKGNGPGLATKSRHWDLRARGFVPMPDGNWLPEAIARSSSANKQGRVGGRYEFASASASGSPDDGLEDVDMAVSDAGTARAASPTPSDLRLRLAKLKKLRPQAHGYGHGHGHSSRHSVDLPPTSGFAKGILSTSPPHPPFGSMPPPPARRHSGERLLLGTGKRKRGSPMDYEEEGEDQEEGQEQNREMSSPSAKKKAALDGGAAVVPGRAETSAMVENTRRMLRELREEMDRADREERVGDVGGGGAGGREEVYLEG
ncbi:SAC3/GANP/Nin1/mts3/eIF-3 p25 family-domain-containing protein [Parachaetomium inaequale]|uniref:SAC3/GANP/Nin1/mts3/eIF-3 p25 family-domain-containing protein n=1 Tax=Parachaetomium inaequale TaxID=2588326 RepID=A0AAN6PG81_9PEZI|nr:SAC3/GANP/Nin1/mts3/eIF-3 p25 family-domain-containing protein [Parachaetomium inaequale]